MTTTIQPDSQANMYAHVETIDALTRDCPSGNRQWGDWSMRTGQLLMEMKCPGGAVDAFQEATKHYRALSDGALLMTASRQAAFKAKRLARSPRFGAQKS